MVKTSPVRKSSISLKVFAGLIAVIVLLTAVHLWMQYLNLDVYHELNGRVFEVSNRVDFDDEASLPTWVSQATLLAIGLGSFLLAYLQRNKAGRRIWGFIGTVGVLLSIDEVAAAHELLLQTVHLALFNEAAPTVTSNAWLILLPFILVAGLALLWQIVKHTPRRTVAILSVGAILFMIGAVFIDILTTSTNANTFYEKGIMVALEESLEMTGAAIILYAILDYLETSYADRIKAALNKLRG
jgi:hypothetical protein